MFVLCRCVDLQPLWDFLHVFDKIDLVYMGLPMPCGLQVLSSVRVKGICKKIYCNKALTTKSLKFKGRMYQEPTQRFIDFN